MATQITVPTKPWLSAYKEIIFGFNDPAYSYAWIYTGVTNNGGKAQFTMSGFNPYDTPPCRLMYVIGGLYAGIHVVTDIDDNGNIITDTDYAGNASGTDARLMVNLVFRVWYGYPTQTNYVDIKPIWNADDCTLLTDLRKTLQSTFNLTAPTIGYDDTMYTHFRVQILPADDLRTHIEALAGNAETVVESFTDWIYDDDSDHANDPHIWYVVNGTLDHNTLFNNHLGNDDELSEIEPLTFFNQCCIFSKIIYDETNILENRVYNVVYCHGTAAAGGIGTMEIESDFIVS